MDEVDELYDLDGRPVGADQRGRATPPTPRRAGPAARSACSTGACAPRAAARPRSTSTRSRRATARPRSCRPIRARPGRGSRSRRLTSGREARPPDRDVGDRQVDRPGRARRARLQDGRHRLRRLARVRDGRRPAGLDLARGSHPEPALDRGRRGAVRQRHESTRASSTGSSTTSSCSSAPTPVIVERLATRTNNPYGKHPEDLARILGDIETVEPLLRRGASVEIDTSAPLERVVETILRLVGPSAPRPRSRSARRTIPARWPRRSC